MKYSKLLNAVFISFLIVSMSSCKKDDSEPKIELFSSDYKNFQLNSGFINNGISIKAEDWSVEYVKDAASGEMLQDKAGKPMVLNALGSVELLTGWLKLKKKRIICLPSP